MRLGRGATCMTLAEAWLALKEIERDPTPECCYAIRRFGMKKGTHHTRASRAKTSATMRGRPKSALTRRRMRAARRRYLRGLKKEGSRGG